MWLQAILLLALPQLIIGYISSCSLPKLSVKLASYPVIQAEVHPSEDSHDPEKGNSLKSL